MPHKHCGYQEQRQEQHHATQASRLTGTNTGAAINLTTVSIFVLINFQRWARNNGLASRQRQRDNVRSKASGTRNNMKNFKALVIKWNSHTHII